jgi:hypothetical protein
MDCVPEVFRRCCIEGLVMTPTERLARAMGYETRTESPGYGVTRVLIKVGELGSWQVFNPRADGLQFAEVLAWLLVSSESTISELDVSTYIGRGAYRYENHNGTGPDLMRAVCDAAERVAEGMAC